MQCGSCQHENREGARFCRQCGAALKRACAECGAELLPDDRFCDACGTPVVSSPARVDRGSSTPSVTEAGSMPLSSAVSTPSAPVTSAPPASAASAGMRKIVSIVFADLIGSTAMQERVDAEAIRQFMERYYAAMRTVVEEHGGRVTQLLGDGVKAVFGVPRVAEDDAARAVRAAAQMQRAFHNLAAQQKRVVGETGLRVSVNTGEVVASDVAEIIGDPVNVAARLQEQGRDGDVIVGEATERLTGQLFTMSPIGRLVLKGRTEPVQAYRLVSLNPPATNQINFVGRVAELARLQAVYDGLDSASRVRLAVILGSPGLGKSRMVTEFLRRTGDAAHVLAAHCDPVSIGAYVPLLRAIRDQLGLVDGAPREVIEAALSIKVNQVAPDRLKVLQGVTTLLMGAALPPEETNYLLRRALALWCDDRPLILFVDDLHWAEAPLLDFVEHLVQWGAGMRVLVVVGARPEFREVRPKLATPGGPVADVISLDGLDATAAVKLAANIIGADDLPVSVATRVLAVSEGNPLFVGELVRMLVREGVLRREGEVWRVTAALDVIAMPPTIHALLAARIERLEFEERLVLEHAAVIGRHFSRAALVALLPTGASVDRSLDALWRNELIEPDSTSFLGDPALRFHHALIRDAAYRSLLKHRRVEMHVQFADWLESLGSTGGEHDEMLGWHLEQACLAARELGESEERAAELGLRAAMSLARAGRRALAQDDSGAAGSLLWRAVALHLANDEQREGHVLDACEALLSSGEVGLASEAIAQLAILAAGSVRLQPWLTSFRGELATLTDPDALDRMIVDVSSAVAEFERVADAAGEAKALHVMAIALASLGRIGECESALDQALAAARRSGDQRRSNAILAGAPLAALWGPGNIVRASGRCLDVVRKLSITGGSPATEAVALACQGYLEALRGRVDAARSVLASARTKVLELGLAHRLHEIDVFRARVEMIEGDVPLAVELLRGAYEGLRTLRLDIDAARAGALLARALRMADPEVDTSVLLGEVEHLAGNDLQASIAWRSERARMLMDRGEPEAAIRIAQDAVTLAAGTDALLVHADALQTQSEVLKTAGRDADAERARQLALSLWRSKGATQLLEGSGVTSTDAAPAAPLREVAAKPANRRLPASPLPREIQRWQEAMNSADQQMLGACLAEDCVQTDKVRGDRLDRAGILATVQTDDRKQVETEVMQLTGAQLALVRCTWLAADSRRAERPAGDDGSADVELRLISFDASLRQQSIEIFPSRASGQAIIEFLKKSAALEKNPVERDVRLRIALLTESQNTDSVTALQQGIRDFCRDDFRLVDHRKLSEWGAADRRGFEQDIQSLGDLATVEFRTLDLNANSSRVFVASSLTSGRSQSGSQYQIPMVLLGRHDDAGLLHELHYFDPEDIADALALFDEMTAVRIHLSRRIAWPELEQWMQGLWRAVTNHDRVALELMLAADFVHVDHRVNAQQLRDETIHMTDRRFGKEDRFDGTVLLTLRPDLAVVDTRWSVAAGQSNFVPEAGEHEFGGVNVIQWDSCNRIRRRETFRSETRGAAMLRAMELQVEMTPPSPLKTALDRIHKFMATQHQTPGDVILQGLHEYALPSMRLIDHRVMGEWNSVDRAAHLAKGRSMLNMGAAGDIKVRIDDVIAFHPRVSIYQFLNHGEASVFARGSFETPFFAVSLLDERGYLESAHYFDVDTQRDDALRLFDQTVESVEADARHRRIARPKLAARIEAWWGAMHEGDRDSVEGFLADKFEAARGDSRATLSRPEMLGDVSDRIDARLQPYGDVLLTPSDRLALVRMRWLPADPVVIDTQHPVDEVMLMQFADDGRLERTETFPESMHAQALLRMFALNIELAPTLQVREVWSRIAGMAVSQHAEDIDTIIDGVRQYSRESFEFVDRRQQGLWDSGNLDAFMREAEAMKAHARNTRQELMNVQAAAENAVVWSWRESGKGIGGAEYEILSVEVTQFDEEGFAVKATRFQMEQLHEALELFDVLTRTADTHEELPRLTRGHPQLHINRAARAFEKALHHIQRGEFDDIAAMTPDLIHEDHRPLLQQRIDAAGYLENCRWTYASGLQASMTLIATFGEHVALVHVMWRYGSGDPREAEVDTLELVVLDDKGCFSRAHIFSMEQRNEAFDVLHGLVDLPSPAPAVNARDWNTLLNVFHPELLLIDHRLTGVGILRGREAYLEAVKSIAGLSKDVRHENLASYRHQIEGGVYLMRASGTLEHGGSWESFLVAVVLRNGGSIVELQIFEDSQLEKAIGLYEARVGKAEEHAANLASRVLDGFFDALNEGKWDELKRSLAPGFKVEDRRTITGGTFGEHQLMLLTTQEMHARGGLRIQRHVLASAGERLIVEYTVFGNGDEKDGVLNEVEMLRLDEVDEEGRLSRGFAFDRSQGDEALALLIERYASHVPLHVPEFYVHLARCLGAGDARLLETCFAPDVILEDRRTSDGVRLAGSAECVRFLVDELVGKGDVWTGLRHLDAVPGGVMTQVMQGNRSYWNAGDEAGAILVLRFRDGLVDRIHVFSARDGETARPFLDHTIATPLDKPYNAARRVSDRIGFFPGRGRGVGAQTLPLSPGYTYEDRRSTVPAASLQPDLREQRDRSGFASTGVPRRSSLAVFGEELLLERIEFRSATGSEAWLCVVELDDQGRLLRITDFDDECRDAANEYLLSRFGEIARANPATDSVDAIVRFVIAVIRQDADLLRAAFHPQLRYQVHRMGLDEALDVEGAVASLEALYHSAGRVAIDPGHVIDRAPGVMMISGQTRGQWVGQAAFEYREINVLCCRDGLILSVDVYDEDQFDAARSRFAELKTMHESVTSLEQ